MMNSNKLIHIILLVAGLAGGIALATLFKGCGNTAPVVTAPAKQDPALLQKHTAQVTGQYRDRLDDLAQNNASLQQEISDAKHSLSVARQRNWQLTQKVKQLAATQESTNDTGQLLVYCDSLQESVQELVVSHSEKDSLYDTVIDGLEQQMCNRDSTIVVQEQRFQVLQFSFDQSIGQLQLLQTENQYCQKQHKKQKVKSKLLSAGILILSGVAAYGILR